MANYPNPQYPNSKKKKTESKNRLFTIFVVIAVAVIAGVVLLLMTLLGWSREENTGKTDYSTVSSQAVSLAMSEASSVASSASNGSTASSGTTSDLVLSGTTGTVKQASDRRLVIVNNSTPLPSDFQLNLVTVEDRQLDAEAAEAFTKLYNAAAEQKQYLYWITYAYRTAEEQNAVFQSNVNSMVASGMSEQDAIAKAEKTIQRGGCSEYETGLSLGLNTGDDAFANTEEYQWLLEHAADYGFILRYPKDKESITGVEFQPWRFRYVGVENAKEMKELNLCLEEYVAYLNQQAGSSASSTVSSNP